MSTTVPTVSVTVKAGSNVRVTVRVQPDRQPLRFGHGNAKLDSGITTFSLPAGWSCPAAADCLSKADPDSGRLKDGRKTRFRCYAASMECRHSSVRRSRWRNFKLLKACRTREEMARLILDSLSPFARLVRVHDSGDFYSAEYLDAWLLVAKERPDTTLYWYSKSLSFWVARLADIGTGHAPGIITNVVPTASLGGREDHLAAEHGLRTARVVFSTAEAADLGLSIDHDDGHAMRHGPDFALLLHGAQPAGTDAARAMRDLRDQGFHGYGKSRVPLTLVRA